MEEGRGSTWTEGGCCASRVTGLVKRLVYLVVGLVRGDPRFRLHQRLGRLPCAPLSPQCISPHDVALGVSPHTAHVLLIMRFLPVWCSSDDGRRSLPFATAYHSSVNLYRILQNSLSVPLARSRAAGREEVSLHFFSVSDLGLPGGFTGGRRSS